MDIANYKGPIIVTVSYSLLYYVFLLNIMRTKMSLHKKYRANGQNFDRYFGQDRTMLAADRIQLNMLEQMPLFLILLWLQSIFVSSQQATILGGIYTISRGIYPFLAGNRMGNDIKAKILGSTLVGYLIIFIFMFNLINALI